MVYINEGKASSALYHVKNVIDYWCNDNPGKKPFVHIRVMEFDESKIKSNVPFDPEYMKNKHKKIKIDMVKKEKITRVKSRHTMITNPMNNFREIIGSKMISEDHELITSNRYSLLETDNDIDLNFSIERTTMSDDSYDIMHIDTSGSINHKIMTTLGESTFYRPSQLNCDVEELARQIEDAKIFKIDWKDDIKTIEVEQLAKLDHNNQPSTIRMDTKEMSINNNNDETLKLIDFTKFTSKIIKEFPELKKKSKYHGKSEVGLGDILRKYIEMFEI
jgi:hypothetical protein